MTGTITRYRRKDRTISWGYYFKVDNAQFTKSGFDSKDEAREACQRAIREAQGLPPVGHEAKPDTSPASKGDKRTLSEYLPYWLDTHAALRCAPKTMERYRDLSAYLARQLGTIRLCDLKTSQIQDAVNRLKIRGGAITTDHPQGRPLSAKTVRSIATLLYTCLGDAARLEHIATNPMGDKRIKLPKRPKANPAVMDAASLGAVFKAAEGTRLYPFVVTAGCSGCRRGELLALTWADVDFEKSTLLISKSLEQTRAGLRVKSTKSEEPRLIGVDDFALEVLASHRKDLEQDKLNFGHDYQDNGLVFSAPNGAFLSPDRVGARVKEVLLKAGLPGFSLHSLRHSHASVLLGEGVPIAVVSERLGHADQNITLSVYSHSLPTDVKAASKVWRNALADVISEDRSRKTVKSLEKSRKLVVNE
jgi:integrase